PKRKTKGKEEKVSNKKCLLCAEEFKDLPAIQRHMMISHSLVYTKENPEGVQNSRIIVKKIGFIDCQKCHKRFRGAQYYNHHTIWCGRETEMAMCNVCNQFTKAMWMQQHLSQHVLKQKQLQKKKELEEEKARKKLVKQEEESDQDEDGKPKKKKRKAAKSALKHMAEVKELAGGDLSDGDSYKHSGDDQSESDDGDEGDEEEEEESDNPPED
ncbi:hypothetical protein EGW08_004485, partial [Elysia chlorotica]